MPCLRSLPIAVFSVYIFLTTEARAAEFDTAVPIDLARALVEMPSASDVRFYDEIPPSFPEIKVPSEFAFVGAMVMAQAGIARIVLKSPHALDLGTEILNNSLQSEGYVLMPRMPPVKRGFIGHNSTPAIYSLCNDDLGALNIRPLSRGGDILFSISGSRLTIDAAGSNCGDRVRIQMEFVDSMIQRENSGIRAQLPIMSVPIEENSDISGTIPSTRSSGGDQHYEISSQLISDRTASYVHDHIKEQLLSQGWNHVQTISEQESNWRTTVEDRLLFGELMILQLDEGLINLYFRISENDGLVIEEGTLRSSIRPL